MTAAHLAREPLPLEELIRLPSTMLPSLSWQKDRIAFYWDRTGRNELFLQTIGRDDPTQLSHGEVARSVRSGVVWNRKGSALAFTRDEGGTEKFDVHALTLATGEFRQLTHVGADMGICEYSPDDRWITFVANAKGRGDRAQLNLWRVASDGGTPEQLTDYANPIGFGGDIVYRPDGRAIAYSANESADLRNSDIYLSEDDGSHPRRIFRGNEGSLDGPIAWHPDGKHLAIGSDVSGSRRPGILNVESGEVRWFGPGGVDESAVEISPNGHRFLTARVNGVSVEPIVYEIGTGLAHPVNTGGGVALAAEFGADSESVIAWFTSPTRRGEFHRFRDGTAPQVLRAADYGRFDPKRFVDAKVVRFSAPDGRSIEALLYAPLGIRPSERFPAIVEVHGGPTAQFLRNFNGFSQHLASAGFVVLQPNIRGSTGYGSEFRDLNRMDWGGADLKDVVAGARYLKSLPHVDPERLGIWGGSFGGFMTYLATVKEPDLWKAGVAWVGISDLKKLYDESRPHYQYYFREQMGEPEANRALWQDRSAVNFAQRLKTHLLMVHGVNDPRCPIDQARDFRDRLVASGKKEGTDFEYLELTEEGHGSSDIEQRLRSYTTVSEFFRRAL